LLTIDVLELESKEKDEYSKIIQDFTTLKQEIRKLADKDFKMLYKDFKTLDVKQKVERIKNIDLKPYVQIEKEIDSIINRILALLKLIQSRKTCTKLLIECIVGTLGLAVTVGAVIAANVLTLGIIAETALYVAGIIGGSMTLNACLSALHKLYKRTKEKELEQIINNLTNFKESLENLQKNVTIAQVDIYKIQESEQIHTDVCQLLENIIKLC